jgi:tetratricopeptide (TPR) repeat protein
MILARFYCAAGDYLLETELQNQSQVESELDQSQGMLFLHKALESSKQCQNSGIQWGVLVDIAQQHVWTGDYYAAQVYIAEGQRLSQLSANLFQQARCLQLEATCFSYRGDFDQSISQLLRGREILDICGLAGGYIDKQMAGSQGEIHLLKSEYAQAKGILTQIINQIIETNSLNQDPVAYIFPLISIAQIDVKIGTDAGEVCQKLNQAKDIVRRHDKAVIMAYCSIVQADLDLRERKFDAARSEF